MLDKIRAMTAVASLLKDKERLREVGRRIKERAEALRATREGGGGAVRVTVNGRMAVLSVELDPALVSGMAADERTRALAGSVIAEAVNAAQAAAQAAMRDIIAREAQELGLGDLPEELTGFLS